MFLITNCSCLCRLISVSLDSAVPGLPGRGDDTSDYSVAEGLEKCFCPVGYAGLSCQVQHFNLLIA